MWTNYRAIGHSRLIFTNTVSVLQGAALAAALGGEVHSFSVLLTATDATAAQRLARREIGSALQEHIDRSKLAAMALDDADGSVVRVPTDDRAVTDVAREVLELAGWAHV